MLSGLNHLTLAVSQLAPSVAFYQQLPGMTLPRWDNGAYFSCGDLWLCLSLELQRRIVSPEAAPDAPYPGYRPADALVSAAQAGGIARNRTAAIVPDCGASALSGHRPADGGNPVARCDGHLPPYGIKVPD